MGNFRFKQFEIRQERTAMKVNTDGALLGAWMEILPTDTRLLDIGTGSGVIALMAAQRMAAKNKKAERKAEPYMAVPHTQAQAGALEVVGLEIDRGSYEDACLNFKNAPWEGLRAVPLSLQQYAVENHDDKFDLIFCNPPYFIRSLKCPDGKRAAARHTHTLEQGELIRDALKLIRPGGRLALILPAAEGERFLEKIRFLEDLGQGAVDTARLFFRLVRLCKVYTTLRKPAKRYLMELRAEIKSSGVYDRHINKDNSLSGILFADTEKTTDGRQNYRREELVIQDNGVYTPEFKALMKEFYLYL